MSQFNKYKSLKNLHKKTTFLNAKIFVFELVLPHSFLKSVSNLWDFFSARNVPSLVLKFKFEFVIFDSKHLVLMQSWVNKHELSGSE